MLIRFLLCQSIAMSEFLPQSAQEAVANSQYLYVAILPEYISYESISITAPVE